MIEYNQEKLKEIHNNYLVSFQNNYTSYLDTKNIDSIDIPKDDINVLYEFYSFLKEKHNEIGPLNYYSSKKHAHERLTTAELMDTVKIAIFNILDKNNRETKLVVSFDEKSEKGHFVGYKYFEQSEKGRFIEDLYAQSIDSINEQNKITKKKSRIGKKLGQ